MGGLGGGGGGGGEEKHDSKTVFSPSTRVIPKLFTNNAPTKQEERG